MPSLAELTDQYPQQDNSLPVAQPYTGGNLGPLSAVGDPTGVVGGSNPTTVAAPVAPVIQPDPNSVGSSGYPVIDKLLGLGGQERYQLWPEKVVRDAISAPHDIIQANPYPEGSEEASWFEDQRGKNMVPAALNMSALAGTGGLAGTGAELGETLGTGPFLRPALKVGDKIYKAPIKDAENPLGFGAEHSDALPAHLADNFYKKAMSGEDINDYNFGFVNHKGQFLDRQKALDYGIEQGLVDPQNGKYGVLTSTMLADSSKPGTAIESLAKTGQPFYSALEHNVNAIPQAKMTGDQWLGTLDNKPGVKPEEMDWTGVKDFLKEKGNQPVSKSELQEHLQNNKVELKEVDKGNGQLKAVAEDLQKAVGNKVKIKGEDFYPDEVEMGLYNGGLKPSDLPTHLQDKAQALLDAKAAQNDPTKYHSYQLPGGENYREKLLTLPGKRYWNDGSPVTKEDLADPFTSASADRVANYGDVSPYKSSHWDEPNILAHVRMNDRIIDSKKSLHLEEIQSDWHQQGRDKGYGNQKEFEIHDADGTRVMVNLPEGAVKTELDKLNKLYPNSKFEAKDTGRKLPGNIPNAPFKKTWHELALKRMIREAAEKGYDRLSWTPGEAQAARYDLSKSVSKVEYLPSSKTLYAFDKNGAKVLDKKVEPENIAEHIGKDAAKKLLETKDKSGTINRLEGQDLKIGGEGMKGFYDQIIPKALEKISGEKVKITSIPLDTKKPTDFKNFTDWEKAKAEGRTALVHYIDIPQSLKDKALGKGFPLFSSTHIFTPVSHNPFSNEKKK